MSSPRAATSVATRIGVTPVRNDRKACSRSYIQKKKLTNHKCLDALHRQSHTYTNVSAYTCCVRSPCIVVAGKPMRHNQSSNASAPRFVSTNTSIKGCCSTEVLEKG